MTLDLARIHEALDNLHRAAPEGGVTEATSIADLRRVHDALDDLEAATSEVRAGLDRP